MTAGGPSAIMSRMCSLMMAVMFKVPNVYSTVVQASDYLMNVSMCLSHEKHIFGDTCNMQL